MVDQVIPPAMRLMLAPRLRVVLVSAQGQMDVAEATLWCRIRPKAGVTVLVRVVPGFDNNTLRSVLTIALSVAAVAAGQIWAPVVLGSAALGSALVTTG